MFDAGLPPAELELAYDALASALDRVGAARESEFLARLALLLMQAAPRAEEVLAAVRA